MFWVPYTVWPGSQGTKLCLSPREYLGTQLGQQKFGNNSPLVTVVQEWASRGCCKSACMYQIWLGNLSPEKHFQIRNRKGNFAITYSSIGAWSTDFYFLFLFYAHRDQNPKRLCKSFWCLTLQLFIRIQAVALFVATEGKDIWIPTALKKVYVCLLQVLGKIPIGNFLGSVLAKRLCIFQQSICRRCLFHTNTVWVITR